MCMACYTQHRWGKPWTDEFVEHMKRALGDIKDWDCSLPPRQEHGSQIWGIALEGEPSRYLILTHEEYRDLLGCPDTGRETRECQEARCSKDTSRESSVARNVNELHMFVLRGNAPVEEHLWKIVMGLFCAQCRPQYERQDTSQYVGNGWNGPSRELRYSLGRNSAIDRFVE